MTGAPRNSPWHDGFYAGVLSALAVIGEDSTQYVEIVQACGARELLSVARRENDIELPRLRNVVAEINRQRRRRRV